MQRKGSLPAVVSSAILVIPISLLSVSGRSYAIPAFSRQYHTSCTTCHIDFPKLNDFGKAFKDAGFKFPKDDETFLKVPGSDVGCAGSKGRVAAQRMAGRDSGPAADRAAHEQLLSGHRQ